ncbi:MAG: tryptophan-rich sensory protein [Clostridia bacterium]|nr:tryptophan-rich sensory protein [Clostridia bacterium]
MCRRVKIYLVSIFIAIMTGALASALTNGNMNIYEKIVKPPLSPPSVLFPIVWTALYVLMGISAAMIYERKSFFPTSVQNALSLYGGNLIVNFTWSIIFFGFSKFLFAFIWLLFLLFIIIRMIISFKKIYPVAAYLQIPYAVWVTFAGYLNFAIYILNK